MSIDKDEIDEVLTEQDYVRLFKELGFSINGHRPVDGWITHLYRPSYLGDDQHADCSLNVQRGIYNDHGSEWSGDIYSLAMEAHDLSFPEAIEWVLSRVGKTAIEDIEGSNNMGIEPIHVDDVKGFNDRLLNSDEPTVQNLRDYLTSRGLTLETVKKLMFGYWKRGNGHWLIIPFESEDDLATKYKLFKVSPEGGWQKEGGSKVVLTCGSGTLMGKQFLESGKSLIICEGELDLACMIQENLNAISPTTGASGWKNSFSEYLRGAQPPKAYIAYDADSAGVKGTKKTARLLEKYDIPAYNVSLPDGKDINDVYLEEGIGYIKEQISDAQRIEVEEKEKADEFESMNARKMLLLLKNRWRKLPEKERQQCLRLINQVVSIDGYSLTKL